MIDKGDWLTFAALGDSVGLNYDILDCEVVSGVFRRHPELEEKDSRSSISRDGYLSLLHYIVAKNDKDLLKRIIKAGKERDWNFDTSENMDGNPDYVNMWPLIPMMAAIQRNKPWMSGLIPMLAIGKVTSGFRAHLAL